MRTQTKSDLDNILDTLTGGDGGVRYIRFLELVRTMDERASEGDKGAEEIIQIMRRFSRLIDVAQTP